MEKKIIAMNDRVRIKFERADLWNDKVGTVIQTPQFDFGYWTVKTDDGNMGAFTLDELELLKPDTHNFTNGPWMNEGNCAGLRKPFTQNEDGTWGPEHQTDEGIRLRPSTAPNADRIAALEEQLHIVVENAAAELNAMAKRVAVLEEQINRLVGTIEQDEDNIQWLNERCTELEDTVAHQYHRIVGQEAAMKSAVQRIEALVKEVAFTQRLAREAVALFTGEA